MFISIYFLEISYYAFETNIRNMVLQLLRPIQEQSFQDQEEFKNQKALNNDFKKDIDVIKKSIFEDGKGLRIFDQLKWQIETLDNT